MRSGVVMLVLLAGGGAPALLAHHNAWAPDRSRQITIAGVVEEFVFGGPHVEIRLRTADGVLLVAEWQTVRFMSNAGITADSIKVGDQLQIRGSPYKNPEVKKITLLAEIRRAGDGWVWRSTQYE
jgi:hypothetical protein